LLVFLLLLGVGGWLLTLRWFDLETHERSLIGFGIGLVIANWLGHAQFGKAPHLVEITPDKRVAWQFADHLTMRTISSVQILDAPGDPLKGGVWH
jgi:hypothetical protein